MHLKANSCSTKAPFWNIPGEEWEGEILSVGRTWDNAPHCSLCLEGEKVKYGITYRLWALANGLAWWSGIWKQNDWGKNVSLLVAQSCLTLCNPMECSPPGFSVHGISQARTPEWVAIPFSKGSSWPRDQIQVSCIASRFFAIWVTRGFLREKKMVTMKFWEEVCGWTSKSGQKTWKCGYPIKHLVYAHQSMPSAEDDFNNQDGRITILWTPVRLSFPGHLVITQWAHNKVAMVARLKVMHGLTNMDFYSPRQTWLWPTLSAQSSSSRDQHRVFNMTLFLGLINQLHGSRLVI